MLLTAFKCSVAATAVAVSTGVYAGGANVKSTACEFGAFVNETDPAGLNVRDKPGTSGKVVGVLPRVMTAKDGADPQARVEVDVRASSNGWFLIANARDNEALTGKPARKLFSGSGWVSGKKLTLKSQATQARSAASTNATLAFKLQDDSPIDNDAMVDASTVVACQGKWAQIELNTGKLPDDVRKLLVSKSGTHAGAGSGQVRGWVNKICALQETACSGTD